MSDVRVPQLGDLVWVNEGEAQGRVTGIDHTLGLVYVDLGGTHPFKMSDVEVVPRPPEEEMTSQDSDDLEGFEQQWNKAVRDQLFDVHQPEEKDSVYYSEGVRLMTEEEMLSELDDPKWQEKEHQLAVNVQIAAFDHVIAVCRFYQHSDPDSQELAERVLSILSDFE